MSGIGTKNIQGNFKSMDIIEKKIFLKIFLQVTMINQEKIKGILISFNHLVINQIVDQNQFKQITHLKNKDLRSKLTKESFYQNLFPL